MTVCRALEKTGRKHFAREENQQGKMEKNKERNSRKQETKGGRREKEEAKKN